jgi:hypothetical protein
MSLFRNTRWSRREVLKQSGMLSALGVATAVTHLGALANAEAPAQHTLPAREGTDYDNLFTRIGVRPLINGRGTYTIISGSRSLPQVKQTMFEASHYFVQLDEMMDGIGAQLGKLTGAEWGIATTGCEAGICLATIACIAGTDVERCQALPYIKGRDQVIIPRHSRNPYDFGVRMGGAELVEVDLAEELRARLSDRTAMIYILSSPAAEKGPLSISKYLRRREREGYSRVCRCGCGRANLSKHPYRRRGHACRLLRWQMHARTTVVRDADRAEGFM